MNINWGFVILLTLLPDQIDPMESLSAALYMDVSSSHSYFFFTFLLFYFFTFLLFTFYLLFFTFYFFTFFLLIECRSVYGCIFLPFILSSLRLQCVMFHLGTRNQHHQQQQQQQQRKTAKTKHC